jgi:hypothetical protein
MFGRKKPPARPPVNMPKQGTPLTGNQRAAQEKLANANAANNRQSPLSVNPLIKPASMSQLRAGANAIRGLPQGSKQTSTRPGMSVTDAIKRASSSFNASNAPKKVASSIFKKAAGGKVSSASSRGDGCVVKGKTKGRMV